MVRSRTMGSKPKESRNILPITTKSNSINNKTYSRKKHNADSENKKNTEFTRFNSETTCIDTNPKQRIGTDHSNNLFKMNLSQLSSGKKKMEYQRSKYNLNSPNIKTEKYCYFSCSPQNGYINKAEKNITYTLINQGYKNDIIKNSKSGLNLQIKDKGESGNKGYHELKPIIKSSKTNISKSNKRKVNISAIDQDNSAHLYTDNTNTSHLSNLNNKFTDNINESKRLETKIENYNIIIDKEIENPKDEQLRSVVNENIDKNEITIGNLSNEYLADANNENKDAIQKYLKGETDAELITLVTTHMKGILLNMIVDDGHWKDYPNSTQPIEVILDTLLSTHSMEQIIRCLKLSHTGDPSDTIYPRYIDITWKHALLAYCVNPDINCVLRVKHVI